MGNKQNKQNKDNKEENIRKYEKKEVYKYNILFVGSTGTGTKTSLVKKIMGDKYIENKSVQKLIFEKNNKEVRLYLFDINGDEGKNNVYKVLYPGSDFIILGYDVTNEQSFEEMENFYNQIEEKNGLIYLLANKIDLQNEIKIPEDKGKNFADSKNIKFFSISVKNDIDVQNFINDLKSNITNKFHNDANKIANDLLNGEPLKKCYKTVLLGESGIGSKTSLLNVVVGGNFIPNSTSSSGASYCSKTFNSKDGEEIVFDFWDTAGQEKYRSMTKIFVFNADIIILGFDVTNFYSFEEIKKYWYPLIKEKSKADIVCLLGNKIDLIKKYGYNFENDVKIFAEENNIRYFLISCATGSGLELFIDYLVNEIN